MKLNAWLLMSCVTNHCLLNNLVQDTLLHVKHWLHGEGYQHNVYMRKCITLTFANHACREGKLLSSLGIFINYVNIDFI